MTQEIWRGVPGFETQFEISDHGRVRSLDRVMSNGRRIKGRMISTKAGNSRGHRTVRLSTISGQKWFGVHRLVLMAYVGPCPDGYQGCHNDGNPGNNHVSNLRWDTPANNTADKYIHGTIIYGENNNLAKLNSESVRRIRSLHAEGCLGKHIAAEFGITPANVSLILRGKTWSHLQ